MLVIVNFGLLLNLLLHFTLFILILMLNMECDFYVFYTLFSV